jgi:hypothetical protein
MMNATKMKQLILSIHDSNMPGDSWCWNFHLERIAGGSHTLSCEQIIEDDPLDIDPVIDLRTGEDIYEALRSMLDNCGYHLGDQNIADIAAKVAKLDITIAKQFSPPSDPEPTPAQERDFYRRVGGGPITILRPQSTRESPPKQPLEEQHSAQKPNALRSGRMIS